MPRIEIVWSTLFLAAVGLFAITVLLRFSCSLANSIGQWSPECELIRLPKYRTCFTIIVAAAIVFAVLTILMSATSSAWAANLLSQRSLHFLTVTAQWLGFASVVAVGLAENQPRSTGLVTLAAILHAGLLLTLAFWLPKFISASQFGWNF